VTRGQLPQRAGLPGLNSGGAAAAVHPVERQSDDINSKPYYTVSQKNK